MLSNSLSQDFIVSALNDISERTSRESAQKDAPTIRHELFKLLIIIQTREEYSSTDIPIYWLFKLIKQSLKIYYEYSYYIYHICFDFILPTVIGGITSWFLWKLFVKVPIDIIYKAIFWEGVLTNAVICFFIFRECFKMIKDFFVDVKEYFQRKF